MQIDIVKVAEIIGACSVILGVIIGGYKLYDKLVCFGKCYFLAN